MNFLHGEKIFRLLFSLKFYGGVSEYDYSPTIKFPRWVLVALRRISAMDEWWLLSRSALLYAV